MYHLVVHLLNFLHHLRLWVLNNLSNVVDVFQKLRESWKHVEEWLYHDDTELLSTVVTSEGFVNKLQGNILKYTVQKVVLDDGSEKLCNLGEVLRWISMQEPVLIEEAMEHACVYLLLLYNLRFFKILHCSNQLIDSQINLAFFSWKHSLKVLICRSLNFFWVLPRLIVLREELLVLHNQLLNFIVSLSWHFVVLSKLVVLKMINGLDELLLANVRSF